MYLENIFIENMGSIEKLSLTKEQLLKDDGQPRIIVLIGKNGSGKTTLLSSIVDSFYQLAQGSFNDVLPTQGMGYQYFKVSGATNQRVNTTYAFSYLQYTGDNKNYEYIDKSGKLSFKDCKIKTNNLLTLSDNWKDNGNKKLNTSTKDNDGFSEDFQKNSYCYFPSDRFEYPHWINEETANKKEFFNDYSSFTGRLDKEILIRKSLSDIKNWILDIFLDSKVGVILNDNGFSLTDSPENITLLQSSLLNIEAILSEIFGLNVSLQLNYRVIQDRLNLVNKDTGDIILPSLDHLSAGQSTLLSIFLNIIKSSDRYDLSKSIELDRINGIVVIDEIDLHLHIGLQKDVLPRLIKLFPKVQFIVTAHSPFFLNGMAKKFNEDDYLFVNMPSGNILNNYDDFEEFEKAYEVFDGLTNQYKKEYEKLKNKINTSTKPLIITEGKTDWKHLKKALERLKLEGHYQELDIEFLEYDDEIEMGDKALDSMVQAFKKTSHSRKVVFVFDRDVGAILKKYGDKEYLKENDEIYAMCIPKISDELDKISIEFYYAENAIKQIDENGRRLFIGTEFNEIGVSNSHQTKIKNKCSQQVIIDEKVYKLDAENLENSVALSKNNFAENILKNIDSFDSFSFKDFKKIFDVIEKIANE